MISNRCGGRSGIRTHEGLTPLAVFKTAALNHSATLPTQRFQRFSSGARRTKVDNCHPIATRTVSNCPLALERGIDGGRRLAVVLPEQMRIDAQGDVRLGMAKAFADGD